LLEDKITGGWSTDYSRAKEKPEWEEPYSGYNDDFIKQWRKNE